MLATDEEEEEDVEEEEENRTHESEEMDRFSGYSAEYQQPRARQQGDNAVDTSGEKNEYCHYLIMGHFFALRETSHHRRFMPLQERKDRLKIEIE